MKPLSQASYVAFLWRYSKELIIINPKLGRKLGPKSGGKIITKINNKKRRTGKKFYLGKFAIKGFEQRTAIETWLNNHVKV